MISTPRVCVCVCVRACVCVCVYVCTVHGSMQQRKGELYWPAVEYGASTMNHGKFSITVKCVDKKPFCTFSQLELTNKDVSSACIQYEAHCSRICVHVYRVAHSCPPVPKCC